jgi:hypothetical protein
MLNVPTKVAVPLAFVTFEIEIYPIQIPLSFLFDQGPFFILLLLCMRVTQNMSIHKNVVLLSKTLEMSIWTPKSTKLHPNAMCLVQVFKKQLLGHIRINACIHLATPSSTFMNPFILLHCIPTFILHWKKNLLRNKI